MSAPSTQLLDISGPGPAGMVEPMITACDLDVWGAVLASKAGALARDITGASGSEKSSLTDELLRRFWLD